jgi:hypothetical protein
MHSSLQHLDVIYLHDIEFVAPGVTPHTAGNHLFALGAKAAAYGLASERAFFSNGKGKGTALAKLKKGYGSADLRVC